jgi:ribosome-associated toxin RatA of RatAB toxin-antitoxin module
MTIVKKSRVVPHTPQQMYDIVSQVEHYPEFVPYCDNTIVHHRDDDEVQASMVIAAGGMTKSFTTKNRLQPGKMIEIRLVDGPFNHLEGFWRFDIEKTGTRISFDLEFEFAGRMLSMLLGPVFEQITNKMVDAFCDRAEQLHGKN